MRQAEAALALAGRVLPAYREHHADLLAHLDDRDLFTPFFLARVFEAVLAQGVPGRGRGSAPSPASCTASTISSAIGRSPCWRRGRRASPTTTNAIGPCRSTSAARARPGAVITTSSSAALEILKATDPGLLAEAQFDPELLDELALDVRAYDHGHPVNRRPNYVFGEWDPHHLDNQGRYRRYVVRKITLDALLDRVEHARAAGPRRAAVGGGGRAGRHRADGVRRQRRRAVGARFRHDAGSAAAAHRALSRCVL